MNDPAHPMWRFLRYLTLLIAVVIIFCTCYHSGFTEADVKPLVLIIGAVAAFDKAKDIFTK